MRYLRLRWFPKRIRNIAKRMTSYGEGLTEGRKWGEYYKNISPEGHSNIYVPEWVYVDGKDRWFRIGFETSYMPQFQASLASHNEWIRQQYRLEIARKSLKRRRHLKVTEIEYAALGRQMRNKSHGADHLTWEDDCNGLYVH